jgi:glutamate transport system substrate-binding protein
MRLSTTRTLAGAAVMAVSALSLAACGGGSDSASESAVPVVENPKFPAGSQMAEFAKAGKITIGVKEDQPGTGFLAPGADTPTGFDISMAEYVAGQMGIPPENITWKNTVSDNREPFLQNGTVDLVLATYSIEPERRAIVGQSGPYYITGQQILVRQADAKKINGPEDLDGIKTCSVTGSTSLETASQKYGANPIPFDTYSACVRQLTAGSIDAVTTDGAILLGYEAQDPEELQVVGPEFSEERYGIGYYPKDDTQMRQFLNDTIEKSYQSGYWKKAFQSTLGASGAKLPKPPQPDPCK